MIAISEHERPLRLRPILFTGVMVRALLAGKKTQTRRLYRQGETEPRQGVVGDRLWVRESLALTPDRSWCYAADAAPIEMRGGDLRIPSMIAWAHHKEGNSCPSIHMPRWASRITLEITAWRCEDLHMITDADIAAEGVDGVMCMLARERFEATWDKINGKRAPWATNPLVWVLGFKRVSQRPFFASDQLGGLL